MKKERISVTLHFYPGEDDAAIAEIERWTKGDRSYNMKQLMLGRFDQMRNLPNEQGSTVQDMQPVIDGVAWLQNAVYELPSMIQEMLSRVSIAHVAPVKAEKTKSTSREEKMRRNSFGDDDE